MSNKNSIAKLRAVTFSQGDYTQSVAQNKQQFFQDIVDARFSFATDYMQIQEETSVGSTQYQNIGVRVTHAISSGLSENFANEIKKIIFQKHNHEQYLGKMYQFGGAYWLTTNLNVRTGISSHSLVRKCNNTLKWVNPSNTCQVFSQPCVFTKEFSDTKFKDGSQGVIQISGDFMILVQKNSLTQTIPYNQRFVFDGHSFQVMQINNHLSDTYMILKLKEIDLQENDNIVENVANDVNIVPSASMYKILPASAIKILRGKSQTYNVYYYESGTMTDRTFTITASQAPSANYSLTVLDGNHFKIDNISPTPIPLIVSCSDNLSQEVTTITIILGGDW